MSAEFLTNKRLTDEQIKKLIGFGTADEPILFAVCGDISNDAKYGNCVLIATKSHIFSYDFSRDILLERYSFDQIEDIFTKRMYGNGVMRIVFKDGKKVDAFRYTFTVAALCDATVTYVKDIIKGTSVEEAYGVMEAVYENGELIREYDVCLLEDVLEFVKNKKTVPIKRLAQYSVFFNMLFLV